MTNSGSLISEDKDRKIYDAEMLYLSGLDLHTISEETGLSIPELRYLAFGPDGNATQPTCWFKKRESAMYSPQGYVRIYHNAAAQMMRNIAAYSAGLVSISLSNLIRRLDPNHPDHDPSYIPSIQELAELAKIHEKFNLAHRLETDQSTQNIAHSTSHMTLRDIHNERERYLYGKSQEETDDYSQQIKNDLEMVKDNCRNNPQSAKDIWKWDTDPQKGEENE